jgi:hypothetical protein
MAAAKFAIVYEEVPGKLHNDYDYYKNNVVELGDLFIYYIDCYSYGSSSFAVVIVANFVFDNTARLVLLSVMIQNFSGKT